jgi:hypothetical protein
MSIKSFCASIVGIFKSGKAERAFNSVAQIVPAALPIVEAIGAITPNRTIQEIAQAYAKYGVPLVADVTATPANQRGYLLLDLATNVLAAKYPGVATNILNSAAQIAVTGLKAK